MPEFIRDAEFWVLIAFVIAIAYLVYKTRTIVTGSLDARAAKIKAELDEAQRLREEAQATLADYQRKQRDALKEAEAIVAQAKAEAERAAEQGARDLDAAIERRKHLAVEKIALTEAKVLAELRNLAVDLAIAALFSQLAGPLHGRFFARIEAEFERTERWILRLKNTATLLEQDPRLALSIRLRNPYIDPMSMLQIDLLARWRAAGRDDDTLFRALVATVNGVSQGLQNTG